MYYQVVTRITYITLIRNKKIILNTILVIISIKIYLLHAQATKMCCAPGYRRVLLVLQGANREQCQNSAFLALKVSESQNGANHNHSN